MTRLYARSVLISNCVGRTVPENLGNIALKSGAGSGKTRELTKRFIFLYLYPKNFALNSLYGITFTNEAALEMKKRILRYLAILSDKIQADDSEQEILIYFNEVFPDLKTRADNRRRFLIHNLSDLNISPFHSLFAAFLSSLPFAAGILPNYEIIDKVEERIIFEATLEQFFESVHQDKKVLGALMELIQQEEKGAVDFIKATYRSLFPWFDSLQTLINTEETLRTEADKLTEDFITELERFKNLVDSKGGGHLNENFQKLLAKIASFIITKNPSAANFDSICEAILVGKNYINKFSVSHAEALKILDNLRSITIAYLNILSDYQILIHLKPLLEVHRQFFMEKLRKNLLSFDDIEYWTLQAFKHSPEPDYLYFKIGAEIRHLLIDEFQDTSRRQLEILMPIISEITSVAPEEKSIFYVGDPHQAIFRWRAGAPELFQVLKEAFPGKIIQQEFIINYRSKKEIVNFVNSILNKNDKSKEDNSGGWIKVKYLGKFPKKDEGTEAVFKETLKIVEDLHQEYGYDYNDIAILVRHNKFGAELSSHLTTHGIPCTSHSHANILSAPDTSFMLMLLRFLDNPQNDFALMHVLVSPIFAIKEETIRHIKRATKSLYLSLVDDHPDWEATKKLSKLLKEVGFCNIYELIFRIYKQLNLNISYSLATLLDVAMDYTRKGFNTLSSFISWFQAVAESIEIKESRLEGVRVLTIHKAKGLEFEIVLIPETDWQLRVEDQQLLLSYKEDGIKPDKIYWRKYGKHFGQIMAAEKERLEKDELNLLYVALTRAKEGIYILGYRQAQGGLGFWFDTITQRLNQTDYSVGEIKRRALRQAEKETEQYEEALAEGPGYIKEERFLYSPTERPVEIIEISRRKKIVFGTLLHKALTRIEWLDGLNINEVVDDTVDYVKRGYARCQEDEEEIEKRLRPYLVETLTDPGLRFIFYKDNQNRTCKNELAIYFEQEKKDVSARIDRLIIDNEKITIIDYKTGIEKADDRRQILLYKDGLKKIYPGKKVEGMLIYLEMPRGNKLRAQG